MQGITIFYKYSEDEFGLIKDGKMIVYGSSLDKQSTDFIKMTTQDILTTLGDSIHIILYNSPQSYVGALELIEKYNLSDVRLLFEMECAALGSYEFSQSDDVLIQYILGTSAYWLESNCGVIECCGDCLTMAAATSIKTIRSKNYTSELLKGCLLTCLILEKKYFGVVLNTFPFKFQVQIVNSSETQPEELIQRYSTIPLRKSIAFSLQSTDRVQLMIEEEIWDITRYLLQYKITNTIETEICIDINHRVIPTIRIKDNIHNQETNLHIVDIIKGVVE